MNTSSYRDDLAFELRMLDVPGSHIGDILAEVETHVADTGEDPVQAFGPARDYARQRAGVAPGTKDGPFLLELFRGHWLLFVTGLVYWAAASWLLISGVMPLIWERIAPPFGWNPWVAVVIGAAMILGWLGWSFATTKPDRIIDPRTGQVMKRD